MFYVDTSFGWWVGVVGVGLLAGSLELGGDVFVEPAARGEKCSTAQIGFDVLHSAGSIYV